MTRFVFLVSVRRCSRVAQVHLQLQQGGLDVADFRRDSSACVQEPRMSWGASGNP